MDTECITTKTSSIKMRKKGWTVDGCFIRWPLIHSFALTNFIQKTENTTKTVSVEIRDRLFSCLIKKKIDTTVR